MQDQRARPEHTRSRLQEKKWLPTTGLRGSSYVVDVSKAYPLLVAWPGIPTLPYWSPLLKKEKAPENAVNRVGWKNRFDCSFVMYVPKSP